MPLETASHISDLVTSNPAASDGMNNADDHMRMIKAVLKNDFPNISGTVTATHTQLNSTVTAVLTDGVAKFDDAGVFFKTSGDGFVNTLAGDIDVKLQGTIAATFQRTGSANFFKITGQIEATTIKASGICPIGAVLIWPSDTLPPTTEGVFAWCNGAAYSRTTYATCYARLGTAHGAGDGSTTFNVPNYQEVTLVGKSGMGGGTPPGLLASIAAGVKDVLSQLFGSDTAGLTAGQIPLITGVNTSSIPLSASGSINAAGGPGNANVAAGGNNINTGGTLNGIGVAVTGSIASAAIAFQSTNTGAGTPTHANIQPSRATNYIVRLA